MRSSKQFVSLFSTLQRGQQGRGYLKILQVFRKELEENYRGYLAQFWFQQNGATPHTTNKSLEWTRTTLEVE